MLYLSLTFFIYATLTLLMSLVLGLSSEVAVIYVIFPFGSYIPMQQWNVEILLPFYVLSSALFCVIAVLAMRDYPLTSFMLASKVFADSFPIIAFLTKEGKVALAIADANLVSYIMVHGKGAVSLLAALFGLAFVILSEFIIVCTIFFRGVGSLPTAVKVLLKPYLGLALLLVILIHEMGHVFFGLLCGLKWVGFGLLFPTGAFVVLKGAVTPEACVLVAAGGNIAVTFYMLMTKGSKSRFIRITRIIGAQLTLLNAFPAIGFSSFPVKLFLYTAIDGSKVLLCGLMSPVAFFMAILVTAIPIKVSLQTLKEERLTR